MVWDAVVATQPQPPSHTASHHLTLEPPSPRGEGTASAHFPFTFLLFSSLYYSVPEEIWVAFAGKDDQPQEQRCIPTLPGVCSLFVNLSCRDVRGFYEFSQGSGELPLFFLNFQLPRDSLMHTADGTLVRQLLFLWGSIAKDHLRAVLL